VTTVEWIAAAFGLVCVVLTVRESVWCWPTGLVQVALYLYVFAGAKLYSDAALHAIYIPLQFYGWWAWLHGGRDRTPLTVRALGPAGLSLWLGVCGAGTLALGTLMARTTDASLPYWDAFIAAASLVAQGLLSRKVLESWALWIAVDVVAIGVFAAKGLYPTAGLYAVFLGLAVAGLLRWRRIARSPGRAGAALPEKA
jgi:nicotinamide mononucleotide transporter